MEPQCLETNLHHHADRRRTVSLPVKLLTEPDPDVSAEALGVRPDADVADRASATALDYRESVQLAGNRLSSSLCDECAKVAERGWAVVRQGFGHWRVKDQRE